MFCGLQRALAALLIASGALMSLEAATSTGHAIVCEPETIQPAFCRPASIFLANSGLGCHNPNGTCAPPAGSTVCEDQAFWGTIEPARCVFGFSDSTLGICLMGFISTEIKVHYMRTVCQVKDGFCSCKGVAFNEVYFEEDVCNCGDLVIPPSE